MSSSTATASSLPSADRLTPSGEAPTGTLRMSLPLAVSMISRRPVLPSVTYTRPPPAAMPRGRSPAGMSARRESSAVSTTLRLADFSLGT